MSIRLNVLSAIPQRWLSNISMRNPFHFPANVQRGEESCRNRSGSPHKPQGLTRQTNGKRSFTSSLQQHPVFPFSLSSAACVVQNSRQQDGEELCDRLSPRSQLEAVAGRQVVRRQRGNLALVCVINWPATTPAQRLQRFPTGRTLQLQFFNRPLRFTHLQVPPAPALKMRKASSRKLRISEG